MIERLRERIDFGTVDWAAIAIVAAAAIAILACIFGAAANESNKISEGIIVDKDYRPAYVYTTQTRINGTSVPQTEYHPAQYVFTIRGDMDGETVEYWFEVTETEYSAYKIGDYYKR